MLRPRYPMLFLLSLAGACLLWYGSAHTGRKSIEVKTVSAALTLDMPRDLVVTSPVPDAVSLQLRGPLSRAFTDIRELEVNLDLSTARPGTTTIPIDDNAVSLPPDVELVSVEPATVQIELERLVTRSMTVEPTIQGAPAPGYQVQRITSTPAQVAIQGPESLMDDVTGVDTSPVDIDGATGSFEATVTLDLPDGRFVRLLTLAPVTVTVEIVPVAADPEAEEP